MKTVLVIFFLGLIPIKAFAVKPHIEYLLMEEQLEEMLKNKDQRILMGSEARKAVYPRFDISRLINDMDQLYTKDMLAGFELNLHNQVDRNYSIPMQQLTHLASKQD